MTKHDACVRGCDGLVAICLRVCTESPFSAVALPYLNAEARSKSERDADRFFFSLCGTLIPPLRLGVEMRLSVHTLRVCTESQFSVMAGDFLTQRRGGKQRVPQRDFAFFLCGPLTSPPRLCVEKGLSVHTLRGTTPLESPCDEGVAATRHSASGIRHLKNHLLALL